MSTEANDRGRPSVSVTMLLALLCTAGVAHVYAGHARRGAAWAGALFGAALVLVFAARVASGGALLALLTLVAAVVALTWIPAAVDAYRLAALSTRRGSWLVVALFWIATEVVFVVTAVGARAFVVEAFKIPSGSMLPSIAVGDHLFVAKGGWSPRRGAVLVFPAPEHPEQDFIKRVLGLPGDVLAFSNGHPVINGTPVPSCRAGDFAYDDADPRAGSTARREGDLYVEAIDGHPYLAFYERVSDSFLLEQGPWTVAPGEVFVVGDNRRNAYDSRLWNDGKGRGVPIETVRGEARVVYLAVDEAGIDWTRVGQRIDALHAPHAPALQPAIDACLRSLGVR